MSKKCKFPVPIQFLLVVLGTLAAWLLQLNEGYGLNVVGEVPTGYPHVSFKLLLAKYYNCSGSGCSKAVERTPHDREVVGSKLPGDGLFLLSSILSLVRP